MVSSNLPLAAAVMHPKHYSFTDNAKTMAYKISMTTTVTTKNMVSVPAELAKQFSIRLGYSFDWTPSTKPDEIVVRVIPDRQVFSKRLLGAGAKFSPGRPSVDELLREREEEPS
jgi:hypothetical protein